MSKEIIFSSHVREEEISLSFQKTYVSTITDFFEFQRQWFFRSYAAFKDFDKYLILAHFFQKTLNSYNEYFVKKSFDEFYGMGSFEIEKFNIVDISRDLFIKKETARRKIIELEKEGIIKKNKKEIKLNQSSIQIQKPDESVKTLARFFSTFSKTLFKNRFIKKEFSTEDFEKLIKTNFTQCWKFFLDFQIPYCLRFKKTYGDLEIFIIVGIIIYNQNLFLRKNSPHEVDKNYFKSDYIKKLTVLSDNNGINAMTISYLTGIPRPTILRKINKLLKAKIIIKDKFNLYRLSNNYSDIKFLDENRLQTLSNLSVFMAKLYNLFEN